MGCLYSLEFSNGKKYIGITEKTIEKRYDNHRRSSVFNDSPLIVHKAWRKYGAPVVKVMVIAEDDYLSELEIKAIKHFNTLAPNGYNLSYGGDVSPMLNPMVAAKVSQALKGRPAIFKGRKHTEASKQKQRDAKLGKLLTEEHKAKIAAGGIGRITSQETKFKISLANRGKPRSEEYRRKISASLTKDPLPKTGAVLLEKRGVNNKRLWSTCKNGHELSGLNLKITYEGKYEKRRCNECARLRTQKYRNKIRSAPDQSLGICTL